MGRPVVAVSSLGCRVNRVELDAIAAELLDAGIGLGAPDEACAVVVNTCAVTGEAEAKTRKRLRSLARKENVRHVVATGCVASLFSSELEALDPKIVVEPRKDRVAARVMELVGVEGSDQPGTHGGITPTGRMRPGIKIQDGCDNRCSYCIVWKARGHARSEDPEAVVGRVRRAAHEGAEEVVLTGINLGRFGSDRADGLNLAALLRRLLEETPVGRVRLSSIEPDDVDDSLVELMAEEPERIARFLHVPLQSGSSDVLKAMNRPYDAEFFRRRMNGIKEALPGIAIATDIIVGFPGETVADFEETLDVVREVGFTKVHGFRYSPRPGTPAAAFPSQVDPREKAARSRRLLEVANTVREEAARSLVGSMQQALVEEPGKGTTSGLFTVRWNPGATDPSPGRLAAIEVIDALGHVLQGRPV